MRKNDTKTNMYKEEGGKNKEEEDEEDEKKKITSKDSTVPCYVYSFRATNTL